MKNKDYWNDDYWEYCFKNNIKYPETDYDNWLIKYNDIIDYITKDKAIDLGCGVGLDTQFLLSKGFDVYSLDISYKPLKVLKENIPDSKVMEVDMLNKLPFDDNTMSLVFANLSTHYFNLKDTEKLLGEIKRVLKKDGYFIGRVNSTKSLNNKINYKKIEDNYYIYNGAPRRLFDKKEFEYFFKKWNIIKLNEINIKRWNKDKWIWEFVIKKD